MPLKPKMSDNEDEEDAVSEQQQQENNNENTLTHNPIEYIDDSCERNNNAWLTFPDEFIKPARMCSVNKYVGFDSTDKMSGIMEHAFGLFC